MANEKANVFEAIQQVMQEVEHVGKTGHNAGQNYSFRSIDDIVAAVQPALINAGLTVIPRVVNHQVGTSEGRSGPIRTASVVIEFQLIGPDGSMHVASMAGEANDTADKATNKAISAATKYFLFYTFWLPVAREDADYFHDAVGAGQHTQAQPRPAPEAQRAPQQRQQRSQQPALGERVAAARQQSTQQTGAEGITQGQSRNLYRLWHHVLGWDKARYAQQIAQSTGRDIADDRLLSKREASDLIHDLKVLAGEPVEDGGDPGPTPPPADDYDPMEDEF